MKVWTVISGEDVLGVFSSPERAATFVAGLGPRDPDEIPLGYVEEWEVDAPPTAAEDVLDLDGKRTARLITKFAP